MGSFLAVIDASLKVHAAKVDMSSVILDGKLRPAAETVDIQALGEAKS